MLPTKTVVEELRNIAKLVITAALTKLCILFNMNTQGKNSIMYKPCVLLIFLNILNNFCGFSCGHECCKTGVIIKNCPSSNKLPTSSGSISTIKRPLPPQGMSMDNRKSAMSTVGEHINEIHARASSLPKTPSLRRIRVCM